MAAVWLSVELYYSKHQHGQQILQYSYSLTLNAFHNQDRPFVLIAWLSRMMCRTDTMGAAIFLAYIPE